MRQIWLISDTHFGHENILTFKREDGTPVRPEFDTVEQMDQCMLDHLNDMVKPGDSLYHLGDVYFSKTRAAKALGYLKAMPFKKRLLLGNHDDGKDPILHEIFGKIDMWRIFKEHNALLTHVPIYPAEIRKVWYNIHGHIHEKPAPTDAHICVCVEHTGYKPVPIEEVMKGHNKKLKEGERCSKSI